MGKTQSFYVRRSMHINNQAKWAMLEQHLGECLRTKKKSQQPVSDLRFEFKPVKREAQYQPTPHISDKYDIPRRSRLSDSIYTDGMKHRLISRLDFCVRRNPIRLIT